MIFLIPIMATYSVSFLRSVADFLLSPVLMVFVGLIVLSYIAVVLKQHFF